MTTTNNDFNKLSIQNITTSINTDTVIADFKNSNLLVFASLVMTDSVTKELQRAFRKTNSIYMDACRRYLNNAGQKYDFIKKKISNSDYNHVIMSRRDTVEKITETNYLYDFVFYINNPEELNSKLYDKLYNFTSIPLLEEWMPILSSKLLINNYMHQLNSISIHNPVRISAYRVRVSKDQLTSLVTDMVKNEEVNINGMNTKSDVIDIVDGLDSYLNIFGDTLAERIQNSFVPKYDPATNNYSQYVNNYDDSAFHNEIELYKAQKATIQASVNNFNVNDVTFIIGEMGCGNCVLL